MGLDHTWKRDIMRQEWSLLCERLSTQIDKTNKIFKEFLFDDDSTVIETDVLKCVYLKCL